MAAETAARYGVIGYPVSHSRSPFIHRLFALQTRQNMSYELLEAHPERLEAAIAEFRESGGKGLNVTVPHKTAVTTLVDRFSGRATIAGAVNTLSFQDGEVFGDNTDGAGLLRDLRGNLKVEVCDQAILILGAGGATRGILGPLLEGKPRSITVANRTLSRANALAERFSSRGKVDARAFSDVGAQDYDLVINATSAGLRGETPPWPAAAIRQDTVCYDLSYGIATPFTRWAQEQGAKRCVAGWGMLVEQAAESFCLWRNVRPDTAPVLRQISSTSAATPPNAS
ncbi:MAG: shikimate dehydrogenase [Woeseia sp.]